MDTKQLPVQHISLLVMHRCQLSLGFSEPLLSGVEMACVDRHLCRLLITSAVRGQAPVPFAYHQCRAWIGTCAVCLSPVPCVDRHLCRLFITSAVRGQAPVRIAYHQCRAWIGTCAVCLSPVPQLRW